MTDAPAAMDYEFLDDPVCVVVRGRGVVDPADALRWYDELSADPRFTDHVPLVFDFRRADLTRFSYEATNAYVARLQDRNAERAAFHRVATVAPEDLQFGIMRMFEALASGVPRERTVVRSMEDALAWIADAP